MDTDIIQNLQGILRQELEHKLIKPIFQLDLTILFAMK